MDQMEITIPPRPNPTTATARAERDAGMAAAAAGQESRSPGWKDVALEWIRTYAGAHASFISEQCTDAARVWGLVEPEETRAWGPVFQRAAREGIIKKDGYDMSTRRHYSPTPLWRSLIYKAAA